MLLVGIVFGCFMLVIWTAMAARLGYKPALGLLVIFPIANLFVISYLAFAESPNETALRRRQRHKAAGLDGEDDYPEFFRHVA